MLHLLSARPAQSRPAHQLLVGLVLVSLAATAMQGRQPPAAAAQAPAMYPDERPNILLITTDDQTVADMAYMPRTRRLLGDAGVTFTDAISPYPLCCPARATILTGQLAHNHKVLTNEEPLGGYQAFREHGNPDRSVGVWLQDAGYNTMFVGKYLNGYGKRRYSTEVPPGWDEWHAGVAGVGLYDYFGVTLNENGTTVDHSGEYQTSLYGDLTREQIKEWAQAPKEDPFFIWESNLAPHGACHPEADGPGCRWGPPMPAEQDKDRFSRLQLNRPRHGAFNERVVSDKPRHIRKAKAWRHPKLARLTRTHRMRVRSLQAVDRSVSETVQTLEDLGELDNTLIIFTSDNGYLIGQHRWHGKILPYEPSLQVPLLMRGPGIPAAATRGQTAALVDLAPTIADAAGAEKEAQELITFDGRSLLPIARGEEGTNGYGALSIESGPQSYGGDKWLYRGVRTHRYTYVEYPNTRELELYDRRKDPDQMVNVAYRPAYRRTREVLAAKLDRLRDCVGQECLSVSGRVTHPGPERHLSSGATVHPDELGSIEGARQVVTITARNWRTGRGMLTAWQRRGRTWTVRRGPFQVRLGSNGLAEASKRRQGTGETPAGTFRPSSALGRLRDPGTTLRYRRFDRNDYWVFDRRVPRTYNVYQRRRSAKARWRKGQAERWWTHRGRYPHAIIMRYNLPERLYYSKRFRQRRAHDTAQVNRGSFVIHVGKRLRDRGWVSTTRRSQLTWLLRWMRLARHRTTFVVGTPTYMRRRL